MKGSIGMSLSDLSPFQIDARCSGFASIFRVSDVLDGCAILPALEGR